MKTLLILFCSAFLFILDNEGLFAGGMARNAIKRGNIPVKIFYKSPSKLSSEGPSTLYIISLTSQGDDVKGGTQIKEILKPNKIKEICLKLCPSDEVFVVLYNPHNSFSSFNSQNLGSLCVQIGTACPFKLRLERYTQDSAIQAFRITD
jgi:hypothetical protein